MKNKIVVSLLIKKIVLKNKIVMLNVKIRESLINLYNKIKIKKKETNALGIKD